MIHAFERQQTANLLSAVQPMQEWLQR